MLAICVSFLVQSSQSRRIGLARGFGDFVFACIKEFSILFPQTENDSFFEARMLGSRINRKRDQIFCKSNKLHYRKFIELF